MPFRKINGDTTNCEPSRLNRRTSELLVKLHLALTRPARFLQTSSHGTRVACSLLTPRWRWALALRRNAIQPGHTEQRAVGPRSPEEPHAHRASSPRTASAVAGICDKACGRPVLSDEKPLVKLRTARVASRRAAFRRNERLLVGESRATIRLVADACDCAGGA